MPQLSCIKCNGGKNAGGIRIRYHVKVLLIYEIKGVICLKMDKVLRKSSCQDTALSWHQEQALTPSPRPYPTNSKKSGISAAVSVSKTKDLINDYPSGRAELLGEN